jgi:rubrerythrin
MKKNKTPAKESGKTRKITKNSDEEFAGAELCDKCGTEMIMEDGKSICPDCDTEIDFFGEDDV